MKELTKKKGLNLIYEDILTDVSKEKEISSCCGSAKRKYEPLSFRSIPLETESQFMVGSKESPVNKTNANEEWMEETISKEITW